MQDAEKPATPGESGTPAGEQSIVDAPTPDAQASFLAETGAHSRSTRRGWIIAGIVAAVLLLAGIAWALWPDSEPKPAPTATPATPPSASVPTTSSEPTQGVVPSLATSSSTTATGSHSARRPQSAPGGVVAPGTPLAEMPAPPERTIGMIVVPKGFTSATFAMVFQPYGWGPGGPQGGRLIAKVISSKPTNASAAALKQDFTGHNVSLWAPPQVTAGLKVGGTYKGTVQVKPQGDVGVLYLMNATLVK